MQADNDVQDLFNAIVCEYNSYHTAEKYVNGLRATIHSLQFMAGISQLQTSSYFRQFGLFVYRINYKKMAVIYTVHTMIAERSRSTGLQS
ncbi:MAG: hypothetical protein ACK5LR_07990 [Mangrovibacterium sp.]